VVGARTADLVIVGRIATLAGDGGLGWVEGVAIGEGRIVAVGDHATLAPLTGRSTRTWRLGPGLAAMPALTDAHLHLTTAALAAVELDLSDAPDRSTIADRIAAAHRERLAAGDRDGWLLGHGWSLDRYSGWPTGDDLDRLAPGRPVALWAHDHHSRWASPAALRAAGVTATTPDPEGGLIRRDPAGAPTGILHEHAAKLLAPAIPRPTRDAVARSLIAYAARLAERGVVGVHDPGEMEDDPDLGRGPLLYRDLAAAGSLPLRVTGSVRPEQVRRAMELGLRSGESGPPRDPTDPVSVRHAARGRVGWLKLFADGALGSRSAALLEAYEHEAGKTPVGGPRGMLLASEALLAERASAAAAAGIAVQIHAIGDRAVRTALDVLGGLPRPGRGIHHRVEHAQLVHADDVHRFARLRVAASVQPCHLASDAPGMLSAWGSRSAWAFPLADLARTGSLLPFGTDAPVESPDPWPGIAISVTRTHAGWRDPRPFHAEQALELARALRAACLDPAQSGGEQDRGRLVPGHRADLVILPAVCLDEPARPDGALAATRPVATLLDGAVVWRGPDFDP
jgi:predicted amidohydrolase YtcJ